MELSGGSESRMGADLGKADIRSVSISAFNQGRRYDLEIPSGRLLSLSRIHVQFSSKYLPPKLYL